MGWALYFLFSSKQRENPPANPGTQKQNAVQKRPGPSLRSGLRGWKSKLLKIERPDRGFSTHQRPYESTGNTLATKRPSGTFEGLEANLARFSMNSRSSAIAIAPPRASYVHHFGENAGSRSNAPSWLAPYTDKQKRSPGITRSHQHPESFALAQRSPPNETDAPHNPRA